MQSAQKYDLTSGPIGIKLIKMSLPAMAINLTQMMYSFVDMAWLGRLSSAAVASAGVIGTLGWLAMTLQLFGSTGAQIGVSQNIGSNGDVKGYVKASLTLSLVLGSITCLAFFFFRNGLIGFFNITDEGVKRDAITYLAIAAPALGLRYLTQTAASIFNASGNSKTPFIITGCTLALNAVLDPIAIFTLNLGIAGASIATTVSVAIEATVMLIALKRYKHPAVSKAKFFGRIEKEKLKSIFHWAYPLALELLIFVSCVMLVSRIVASFGYEAMATQRIGNQIDQFSYFVAGGFSTALSAFIGQNYGAGRHDRIRRGFWISTLFMGIWGVLTTANLLLFNRLFFKLFVPNEPAVIEMGSQYLKIFSLCQMAACLEGVGNSVFRGYGKTMTPAVSSTLTNILRVILAFTLSKTELRQNGVWLAIAVTAFLRGAGSYLLSLFSAYPKIPQLAQEKSCEGFNADFSKP
ncbi:MAG: MATE family efflux transporter [Clostridiales bacterium]|jgi:putative MATE family efflux protein|nr:MATE family efflux transporter [Clostridiales bacterium]MDR2751697.1 MATE family efflux transporter [Clostridiales bacterium]